MERGDPRGGELVLTEEVAVAIYGSAAAVRPDTWAEYAGSRPEVAGTPAEEAAACLLSRAAPIVEDAIKYEALPTGACTGAGSHADYESALHAIAGLLLLSGAAQQHDMKEKREEEEEEEEELWRVAGVPQLLEYLDERMCVPRDLGAPAAESIRSLRRRVVVW